MWDFVDESQTRGQHRGEERKRNEEFIILSAKLRKGSVDPAKRYQLLLFSALYCLFVAPVICHLILISERQLL